MRPLPPPYPTPWRKPRRKHRCSSTPYGVHTYITFTTLTQPCLGGRAFAVNESIQPSQTARVESHA